jgi:hypothetical protein
MQMAGRLFWEVRPDGSVRTDGLHLEGFAYGTPFARRVPHASDLRGGGDHAAGSAPLRCSGVRAAPPEPPGVGRPEHGRRERPAVGDAGGGRLGSA